MDSGFHPTKPEADIVEPRSGDRGLSEGAQFPERDAQFADNVQEFYGGIETPGTDSIDVACTLQLFEHLAVRMNGNVPAAGGKFENPNIPAGYTYLAQFAAHDLTLNSEDRADLMSKARGENRQTRPLLLDSLYGNGPIISSFCYRSAPAFSVDSAMLRLERIGKEDGTAPRRDIGRICEYAGNALLGRPLVADSRSDDNAVLSQLVTLFSMAHNAAVRVSASLHPDELPFAHYKRARLAVTCVYRSILRYDLLPRLLDAEIYGHYGSSTDPDRFLIQRGCSDTVSREFADAAFRIGHAMVRSIYRFNGRGESHPIQTVLTRTSEADPDNTPLDRTWIVEWSRFFDIPTISTPERLQYSMAIGPGYGTGINSHFKLPGESDGSGLAMRDLKRSAVSRVRKLRSLRDAIAEFAPEDFPRRSYLTDGDTHRAMLARWARRPTPPGGFGGLFPDSIPEDLVDEFASNPPLLLFILIEASEPVWNGERLGPLGSVIVAETFFRALDDTSSLHFLCGSDEDAAHSTQIIFDGAPPSDMASLILWLDRNAAETDKRLPDGEQLPIL